MAILKGSHARKRRQRVCGRVYSEEQGGELRHTGNSKYWIWLIRILLRIIEYPELEFKFQFLVLIILLVQEACFVSCSASCRLSSGWAEASGKRSWAGANPLHNKGHRDLRLRQMTRHSETQQELIVSEEEEQRLWKYKGPGVSLFGVRPEGSSFRRFYVTVPWVNGFMETILRLL